MVEPAYEAVYHTYDEMEEYLTKWVDAHGEHALPSAPPTAIPPPGPATGAIMPAAARAEEICELGTIGTSSEGRELMIVTVTDKSTGPADSKPGCCEPPPPSDQDQCARCARSS